MNSLPFNQRVTITRIMLGTMCFGFFLAMLYPSLVWYSGSLSLKSLLNMPTLIITGFFFFQAAMWLLSFMPDKPHTRLETRKGAAAASAIFVILYFFVNIGNSWIFKLISILEDYLGLVGVFVLFLALFIIFVLSFFRVGAKFVSLHNDTGIKGTRLVTYGMYSLGAEIILLMLVPIIAALNPPTIPDNLILVMTILIWGIRLGTIVVCAGLLWGALAPIDTLGYEDKDNEDYTHGGSDDDNDATRIIRDRYNVMED